MNSANVCSSNTMTPCDLEDLRGDDSKCFNVDGENCPAVGETLVACPNVVTGFPKCSGGSEALTNNCCGGDCGGFGTIMRFTQLVIVFAALILSILL